MKLRRWAAACLPGFLAVCASAQEFEVASVKPADPDERRMFIGPGPGGGISVTNMTLKQMIQNAWRVMPVQISEGPAWIDAERYNVVAKPRDKAAPEENMRMLQALLKERFHLTIHAETKEMPVYALVLARKDGKLGEHLTESKEGACMARDPNLPPPLFGPGGKPGCGGATQSLRAMNGVSAPMTELARSLTLLVGRTVIDKTGLSAKYDYTVGFTPDQGISSPGPGGVPPVAAALDSSKPPLFTALQEQLGLKLEAQRGPVEILVIDHVEKPSEN